MIPTHYNRLGAGINQRNTWVIEHGAGKLDISISGTTNLLWQFPDGSTSTATRPAKTVTKGTTIITCDDFSASGVDVYIYGASSALASYPIPIKSLPTLTYRLSADTNGITGKIADLPRVTNHLSLAALSGLTGTVADLPRVTYSLTLNNISGLTGTTADLPIVTDALSLNNLPGLTGTVADLPRVTTSLQLTNLSGLTGTVAGLPRVTHTLSLSYLSGLTGTTADLPRATTSLTLSTLSGLTGTTADLPRVTNTLSLNNLPGLTGTVEDLPRVTYYLYLNTLSGLTGTVVDAPETTGEKRIITCISVIGAMSVTTTNTRIDFYGNASVTPAEYDQTVANCVAAGGTGKTLYISSRRTSASDADVATLLSRGWTVNDSNI